MATADSLKGGGKDGEPWAQNVSSETTVEALRSHHASIVDESSFGNLERAAGALDKVHVFPRTPPQKAFLHTVPSVRH